MMKSSTMVLVGGAGLIGAMLLFSQNETDILDDDVTPSYVPPDEIDTPDNKDTINQEDYDDGGDLLPSNNMWNNKDGKTIRIYHPLKDDAQLGQYFDSFYFEANLIVDWITSIYNPDDDKTIDDLPETIGDYTWELTRSGGWQDTVRWTTLQNGADIRGLITKSNVYDTIEQITPTWDSVLAAFGDYMVDKKVVGPNLTLSGGQFSDTEGNYKYVAYYEDGTEVPTSFFASNMVKLQYTMSGAAISMDIKLKYRCGNSGDYTLYSSATYPFPSPYFGEYGTGGYYFPIEDAPEVIRNPQGVSYGCTIPIESKSLPQSIRVIQENGANTSYVNHIQISIDDLIISPYTVSVPNGNDYMTDDRVIYDRLFPSRLTHFPMVHKDGGGYYVLNTYQDHKKAYISTLILGFDALYQRRQVQCTCPGGSVNVGQTVTIYDANNCPSWYNQANITEHCGGVSSGSSGGSSDGGLDSGSSSGNSGEGNISIQNAENVNYILSSQSYINL